MGVPVSSGRSAAGAQPQRGAVLDERLKKMVHLQ